MRAARGRILGTAMAVSLLASMLAACGSGGSSQPSPSPTLPAPPSSSGPSTAAIARQDALGAYQGMWQDVVLASRTANYRSPLLPEHAAGAALSQLVRNLYTFHQEGLVIKGQPQMHPVVVSLLPAADPTQARIADCFDDTHWLVYKADGGLANKTPGGHRRVTALVREIDGTWKVTKLEVGAEGTCSAPSSS